MMSKIDESRDSNECIVFRTLEMCKDQKKL